MAYLKPGGRLFFIWHSDLTAIRLPPERWEVMNFTLSQIADMFVGFETEAYATTSRGRVFSVLGKYALSRYVTKISLGWTAMKNNSWDRARLIVTAKSPA
jgi:hypothetical protein